MISTRITLDSTDWLQKTFRLHENKTSISTEAEAGLATFMVMAYIIFVNPTVLGAVADSTGEKLAFPAIMTVTCLTTGILCLLMGSFANYPFAIGPGMGLNAIAAFQLVGQLTQDSLWEVA